MAALLDTHTFLWFVSGDNQLPEKIKNKILDINEPCYISIASFWEITIKIQIGKLKIDISLEELFKYADRNQIEIVQITSEHLLVLAALPQHHSDPFDRLIVSQAISENLTLYSRDKGLKKYALQQEWG
jgi:PIN domain nuclease of toxin-antitoxin system